MLKTFFIAILKKFLGAAMHFKEEFIQSIQLVDKSAHKKSTLSTQSNKRFRESLTNTQMYNSIILATKFFYFTFAGYLYISTRRQKYGSIVKMPWNFSRKTTYSLAILLQNYSIVTQARLEK